MSFRGTRNLGRRPRPFAANELLRLRPQNDTISARYWRKSNPLNTRDRSKRNMSVGYGDRTFALRAYRDGGAWHGVIVENHPPLRHSMPPAADPAACLAATVEFVVAVVDASVGFSGAKAP